ncbi:MAG: glycosyltransferase family 2 protein, partial [Lentisphaeria bacterium]
MKKNNVPLVTVVIPSYNHEKYIEKAIYSVLAQTYKNIELIVIDDGSKDSSPQLITELANEHGFKFIARENHGLMNTLNEALGLATGEFFCSFSSDDIMAEDYIEKQLNYLQKNRDVALICATLSMIDGTGEAIKDNHSPLEVGKYGFDDVALRGKNLPAPAMIFRIEKLREIGGFNPKIQLEDVYIQLKLTNAGYLIGNNPEATIYYRMHGKNNVLRESWMTDQMFLTINEFKDHPKFRKIRKVWYLRLFKKYA